MWQATLVAALLPVLAGAPRGVEKPSKPKSPPPNKASASVDANGVLLLTLTSIRQVPVLEQRIVQQGGVVRAETVTTFRNVNTTYNQRWEIKDLQAFDKDGQKIDAKGLPKLLKNQTPVLVSADGKKVHSSYLKDAKEGTVILVLPIPKVKPQAPISKPTDQLKRADK
jgi:hypothetical protein